MGVVTVEKPAPDAGQSPCPGTNQVINPVDMFILKRKAWGRGLWSLHTRQWKAAGSIVLGSTLLPGSLGFLISLLLQGFSALQPRTWG